MFTSSDMVYNVGKEGIQSGGMKVNSILLKNGDPLGSSYSLLKNIEKFVKKKAPPKEDASY